MKNWQYIKSLVLFGRAFSRTRREMWLSLQALGVVTLLLAAILFWTESRLNPDFSFIDSLVWVFVKFVDDPADIVEAPQTLCGQVIGTLIGFVGIALVAIPAGLIGSGFMEVMDEEKRAQQLADIRQRLEKAFRPFQCRYTKERVEPRYVSVANIQARQHIDLKDIMDAVNDGANYRLCNLATTQNVAEHPQDKLVVEHFPTTPGTPYGCCLDRGSNVTIVSPSGVHEAGISHFARCVAALGGFNFVGKEWEADEDNPVSFYVVQNPDHEASHCKRFVDDVKALSCGTDKWVIFFISASGAEEPAYPTHFHFIYGAKRGDEGYTDPNLTICDTQRFDAFYQQLSAQLRDDYGYESDRHRYHTGAGKKNVARCIGGGARTNAFTLRTAFQVTVWDDRHVAIAKTIAEAIREQLCG